MLFTSFEFLVFLFIVFLAYHAIRSWRWQNLFIVFASYIFYGWWDWRFLVLITITTLCSYASGLMIAGVEADHRTRDKWICGANIVLNLGLLAVFKYYNFFVSSFANLFGLDASSWTLNVILPVGISFYTFQALSYSIDVYRGKIQSTRDIIAFTAYISFFPQLVAGPIERAQNLLPQFLKPRTFDYDVATDGCRQMLWGFFKKIVVADGCARCVDMYWNQTDDPGLMAMAVLLFTFQIYGDFSGYSDIAIGCAKLFGIQLRRNFNVPFFSRDIAEFWRRWHISLNTWFIDYLYIPLGGSRVPKLKVVRNTFAIFLVSGLWHGANWTYVCWGAFHACLFMPLILMGKNRKYTDIVAADRKLPTLKETGQMLFTFLLVVYGFMIFRATNITEAMDITRHLASLQALNAVPLLFSKTHGLVVWLIFMLVVEWIQRKRGHGLEFHAKWWIRYAVYIFFIVLFIFRMGENQQFIYFQF